jgi:hypothetical protein
MLAALLSSSSPADIYAIRCEKTICHIAGAYLEFDVKRVGRSLAVQPTRFKPEVNGRPSPDWISATQYQVVPELCFVQGAQCHFLFGPRLDVTRWVQREDSAYLISTRDALNQLRSAKKLRISVTQARGDMIDLPSRIISAEPFLAAIAEADKRLRMTTR